MLPPCTDQELVITNDLIYHLSIGAFNQNNFTDNKAFFQNIDLILINMLYIYVRKILWEFITIINLPKETSLWRSKQKEKKLAEKKAKRLAKEGPK